MENDLRRIVATAAADAKLHSREDIREPGWAFWELRNINMHRVIGLMTANRQFPDVGSIQNEIRGKVGRNFKVSWWRGMAFGAVAEVSALSLRLDDLKELVDIRENEKGDLQWLVLVVGEAGAAVGVHTWIEGYLSPVYRRIVEQLANTGYKVANAKREKDGLMRFLTGTADVDAAIRSFGMRRTLFEDFQEPTLPDGQTRAKGS